jgi:SAM-dependent methyltransferase
MSIWDERYDSEEYQYGTTANDFLRSVAAQTPVGKTLCLAEGEGRNAVYLAELGHQVTAVDSSVVGLKKAQLLARQRHQEIKTCTADLADFIIEPESWDTIISIYCHVAPEIRPALHRKVVAGLRSGGMLVLEAYRPEQLKYRTGGPPAAEMMMTLELLRHELCGLNFIHAVELDRDVIEGRLHTGKGAVVQLLAVKP